jgi:hypothetical protein
VKRPSIHYLVASPAGDIPVDTSRLDYPLEGDPLQTPYRIYFQAISDFLSREHFQPLLKAVSEHLGTDFDLGALNEIIVRTEKHGALYHPASIECMLRDGRAKFGLHVAMTDIGRDCLIKEFALLKTLHARFSFSHIPMPYHAAELHSMVFLLEEWFEDYHEFHIAKTENGKQQMKLWEYGKGDRVLSSEQGFEIYRQSAQILTLYYDLNDFYLIYPWHHAAGDFVVRIGKDSNPPQPPFRKGGNTGNVLDNDKNQNIPPLGKGDRGGFLDKIDVKLTTVRGYEPFLRIAEDDMISPVLALFYFLLHLSIQMRLDKLDGVGEVAWADGLCVDATLTGFLEGLKRKNDFRECCGSVRSFLMLLKSFTKEDLRKTAAPIAEQFEQTKDYRIIQEHFEEHVERLYLTLQNFP